MEDGKTAKELLLGNEKKIFEFVRAHKYCRATTQHPNAINILGIKNIIPKRTSTLFAPTPPPAALGLPFPLLTADCDVVVLIDHPSNPPRSKPLFIKMWNVENNVISGVGHTRIGNLGPSVDLWKSWKMFGNRTPDHSHPFSYIFSLCTSWFPIIYFSYVIHSGVHILIEGLVSFHNNRETGQEKSSGQTGWDCASRPPAVRVHLFL